MNNNELLSTTLKDIYAHLADEESRDIFIPRFEHIFHAGEHEEALISMMHKAILWDVNRTPYKRWNIGDSITIGEYLKHKNAFDSICIWGAGRCGKLTLRILNQFGLSVECFLDNDKAKVGTRYLDKPVYSSEKIFSDYHNAYIFIGMFYPYAWQVIQQLRDSRFPSERIILMYSVEEQYFGTGLIEPREDEVYYDVGVFDGATIDAFIRFSNNRYKQIIGIEADKKNYDYLLDKYKNKDILRLINKGAWNESGTFKFNSCLDSAISKIDDIGETLLETTTIDKITEELQLTPTFIKMDIEGAELKALEGAEKTIKHCHPRLAISVYHKAEDIADILHYILRLVPEYKFYLRQHTYHFAETVLYCMV
ncbi:MAG: FkbM family methyltransferase [Fibromonadales bacterium]|nr:FkbM family methyltransferase [Fibromonadales bacterium]